MKRLTFFYFILWLPVLVLFNNCGTRGSTELAETSSLMPEEPSENEIEGTNSYPLQVGWNDWFYLNRPSKNYRLDYHPVEPKFYGPSNLVTAWTEKVRVGSDCPGNLYFRRFEDGVWSPVEIPAGKHSWLSDMAVNAKGEVVLIWKKTIYSGDTCDFLNQQQEIQMAIQRNGIWSAPIVVEKQVFGSGPRVSIDGQGIVTVAWKKHYAEGRPDSEQGVYARRYGQSGWLEAPLQLNIPLRPAQDIDMGVDASGNVHLAWAQYTNLPSSGSTNEPIPTIWTTRFLKASNQWVVPYKIGEPNMAGRDTESNVQLHVLDNGVAYAFWAGFDQNTGLSVHRVSRFDSKTDWTPPRDVINGSANRQGFQFQVNQSEDLRLTWIDRVDGVESLTTASYEFEQNSLGSRQNIVNLSSKFNFILDEKGNAHFLWSPKDNNLTSVNHQILQRDNVWRGIKRFQKANHFRLGLSQNGDVAVFASHFPTTTYPIPVYPGVSIFRNE